MKMRLLSSTVLAIIAGGTLMAQSANASVVLQDNFDADTPAILNWLGDSVFVPVPSTPVTWWPIR